MPPVPATITGSKAAFVLALTPPDEAPPLSSPQRPPPSGVLGSVATGIGTTAGRIGGATGVAVEPVGSETADEQIRAGVAGDEVIARAAVDAVSARAAGEGVVAAEAHQPVVAEPAADRISAVVGADEKIVARTAVDVIAAAGCPA